MYEVELLSKLVSYDTSVDTKKEYVKCAEFLVKHLKSIGLKCEVYDGKEVAGDGIPRPNIIARIDRGVGEKLVIASHYDVVPAFGEWKYPPFKLTLENGKAYGRGASDAKGQVVAMIAAAKHLVKCDKLNYDVELWITCDEEVGGKAGIGYLVDLFHKECNYALIVDSSAEYLAIGASGILWLEITVEGIGGHAGYPFAADNAIYRAIKVVNALLKYAKSIEAKESILNAPPKCPRKKLWPRLSVTYISAGRQPNMIPGTCTIKIDRRLIPEEDPDEEEQKLKEFLMGLKDVKLNVKTLTKARGYATDPEHPFVKRCAEAIYKATGKQLPICGELGGNDGHYFASKGIPVACFGTCREDNRIHDVNEFVYIKDIEMVRDMIIKLASKEE